MNTKEEITFDSSLVTPKEQATSESLRQKDFCRTQLWREFTLSKPPKKQASFRCAPFWLKDRDFLGNSEISIFMQQNEFHNYNN